MAGLAVPRTGRRGLPLATGTPLWDHMGQLAADLGAYLEKRPERGLYYHYGPFMRVGRYHRSTPPLFFCGGVTAERESSGPPTRRREPRAPVTGRPLE